MWRRRGRIGRLEVQSGTRRTLCDLMQGGALRSRDGDGDGNGDGEPEAKQALRIAGRPEGRDHHGR